jgi:hypothetical protein
MHSKRPSSNSPKYKKYLSLVIGAPPLPSDKLPKHEIIPALAGLTLKNSMSFAAIKKHGFYNRHVNHGSHLRGSVLTT